jgi:hypothetical protein
MAILDLISQVHLPSSGKKLPKYLKHFTFSSFQGHVLKMLRKKMLLAYTQRYFVDVK